MATQHVIDWTREALRMALLLAGPPLAAALLVALLIGALQTMMQLNEPVVSQLPRIGAIALVVFLVLPWLITTWVGYTRGLIGGLAG